MRIFIIFCVIFITLNIFQVGAICTDGWSSQSIGTRGACSSHGGVSKIANMFIFFASIVGSFYIDFLLGKKSSPVKKTTQTEKVTNRPPLKATTKSPRNIRCPKCRSKMVLRTAKKGKNIGKQFYGCSRYPKCRRTINFVPP